MDWTWYLFGFKGRINRAKYWLAGLIIGCWMLLLATLTTYPPAGAAVFRATVQLSVPAPVIDPLAQLTLLNTGKPAPLRLINVDVPEEELLLSVSEPEAVPAAAGSNCTFKVAV